MKDGYYESRKEQIEKGFLRHIVKELKADGITLTRRARRIILEELRAMAMVAAAEERERTLKMVDGELYKKICAKTVLEVLGYE